MPKREEKQATPAQNNALEQNVQNAVDQWYRDVLHNTVVSRDTDVHNLIHNAKPALIEAVTAAVRQYVPNQE